MTSRQNIAKHLSMPLPKTEPNSTKLFSPLFTMISSKNLLFYLDFAVNYDGKLLGVVYANFAVKTSVASTIRLFTDVIYKFS